MADKSDFTSSSVVTSMSLPEFPGWEKLKVKRIPSSFDLELTARCNNNCRHCFINLPAEDGAARERELSLSEIEKIADEAVSMGSVWCLLTGGEPLLREDFFDIYMMLKKKGLLISVFTNAVLISEKHIELFKKYPPRDIEVSVYGVTEKTYRAVTRSGSFPGFVRGLDMLLGNGIGVILKAMAIRSNFNEIAEILQFCRERSKASVRFDPFLHLRYDRNPRRNEEIIAERLTPEEIIDLEKSDKERYDSLLKGCDRLIIPDNSEKSCSHIFNCGAGGQNFVAGYDGYFRLCQSLNHRDFVYDLRTGDLGDAWNHFVPKVRDIRSSRREFIERCHQCRIVNLCAWCPAHAHLETGELDLPVEYFCEVAHLRAKMLDKS